MLACAYKEYLKNILIGTPVSKITIEINIFLTGEKLVNK